MTKKCASRFNIHGIGSKIDINECPLSILPLTFKVSVCIDSDKSRIKYNSLVQPNDICIVIVQFRLFCCKCPMHGKDEWFSCKPVGNHSFQSRMQGSQRCRKCCNSLCQRCPVLASASPHVHCSWLQIIKTEAVFSILMTLLRVFLPSDGLII